MERTKYLVRSLLAMPEEVTSRKAGSASHRFRNAGD
jgi:hypothetical protein